MKVQDLIRLYPMLYHMAESGSWPSIQNHGLLSTSALLDLYGVKGQDRREIESRWRKECVTLRHPLYGSVVIRDQKPLNEKALSKFVDGMSPREYYELLNGKTFFWVRRERLEGLLNGEEYRGRAHSVLTVDTSALVANHHDSISLSPINSGAFFGSGRRGVQTFKPIEDYPFEDIRKKKRNKDDAVVELAVEYAVNDMADLTIRVEEWLGGTPTRIVWERGR